MFAVSRTRQMTIASHIFAVALFSLVQAIAARIRIPLFFTPVPVTFQTLVVLMSVVVLRRRAVFAQALYITLGICGLPFFTSGAGWAYLFGPTGGYLLGFFLVALILPSILEKSSENKVSLRALFVLFSGALLLIYLPAVFWLKLFCSCSLPQAVMLGVVPFIPGAVMKTAIASVFAFYYMRRR